MFKKILAILCTVVILSFSCIFTPTSKAMKMQQIQIEMEAEASAGILIGGAALIVVVCVVLIWYGVSVTTDSTEAQSCLEFVKEKAEAARISMVQLELNAFLYLVQIKAWVAEWIASQSGIYGAASGADITLPEGLYSLNGVLSFDASFEELHGAGYCFPNNSSYPRIDFFCYTSYPVEYTRAIIYRTTRNGYDAFNLAFQSSNGSLSDAYCPYRYIRFVSAPASAFQTSYYIAYDSSDFESSWGLSWSSLRDLFYSMGVSDTVFNSLDEVKAAISTGDWDSLSSGIDVDTSKKVVIPAAKDVYDGTGDLSDYAIDNPDVIDFGSALSQLQSATGNPALTWEDVIGGVNTGAISASDVLEATDAVPYVLTDSRTGELATSDTPDEYVKPVALTSDLAIPAATDAAISEPYTPRYDNDSDSTKKFRLPLFQYFPFCLPWDIYDVLSSFDADPVAPVLEIPIGNSFRNVPGVTAKATSYVMKLDLGEEQYAKWFRLLRLLECVGIIVGFVLIARSLIHGGN